MAQPGTTEDHELLRRSVRDFLAAASPEREVRRLMDTPTGFDPAMWSAMARQLELQAIAIPERYGHTSRVL